MVAGYISNLRTIYGTALYSGATYTVPTTPLTAVSGTSLLTCQSNRFRDSSSNNFSIGASGNTSVQRFSPFVPAAAYSAGVTGGSAYLDGSGDYLTVPDNTAWQITGDYTIECWVYATTINASQTIVSQYQNTTNAFAFGYNSTSGWYANYRNNAAEVINYRAVGPSPLNRWTHVAFVKSSTTMTIYVNGSAASSTITYPNLPDFAGSLHVGVWAGALDSPWAGYISNLRLVKGTAVYTGNFTPPTAPLTAVANTQLLTNFTNAGIWDSAMINDLETVGNAQISTSVVKYGTGSMAFDGTGDYLTAPSNANYVFGTGDFTAECWVYLAVGSKAQAIFDTRVSGPSSTGISLAINASNAPYVYVNAATLFTSSTALTLATWTHVAMVKASGTITLYINGTSTGSAASATNLTDNALTIGSVVDYRDGSTTLHLNGYIDDLRITRGYARYTSNFTPPGALS
jgi:hypothetical protein